MGPRISFKVSAPGKVILMGEHSVVYGKTALAASLSLRTYLSFNEIDPAENMFHLELPMINLNYHCEIDKIINLFKECPPPLLKGKHGSFNMESPNLIDVNLYISTLRTKVAELTVDTELNQGQENALIAFFIIFFGMFSGLNLGIVPISITVMSDLTVGAGTGSSASYGACLASAFYQYVRARVARDANLGKDIAKTGYKSLKISSKVDLSAFNENETNIILSWAVVSDHVMHGNPSGIDASVISYGNVIEFRRGENGKPSFMSRVPGTNAMKILLVNSGVTRDTKQMVAVVTALRAKYPAIVNAMLCSMDQVALAAKEVFREVQMVQWSLETVRSNRSAQQEEALEEAVSSASQVPVLTSCDDEQTAPEGYPVAECEHNAASQESVSCERFDSLAAQLGELININQHLLCSLGVSHPSLDEICRIAAKNGFSAKLTGAGGGGYAIILLPPRLSESRVAALQADLKACGFDATFALMGGAGVILEEDGSVTTDAV